MVVPGSGQAIVGTTTAHAVKGIDAAYKVNMLTVGATAFRDNDTMGTLLAWRGWDVGSRLTVYNETLPLTVPPAFVFQMPGGTLREKKLHCSHARIDERASLRRTAGHHGCLMMGQHEVRERIRAQREHRDDDEDED